MISFSDPKALFKSVVKTKKYLLFEVALIVAAFFYYLYFANKGLDLFDEGYTLHAAERIAKGEIPYKDFALQYTPAYFYLLALLYKVFGFSIIVGRCLNLLVCSLVVCFTFLILNILKLTSFKIILLSFLGIVAFGYPLINIPLAVWPEVLISQILVYVFVSWIDSRSKKSFIYLIIIGTLLALSFSVRQNLGLGFILVINFLVFFSKKLELSERIKNLLVLDSVLLMLSFFWIYYFFLKDNIVGLLMFINFSRKFSTQFGFTYPPLSYILQPAGILKLLPYYLPYIFAFFVIWRFLKDKNWKLLSVFIVPLVGFVTYIYPNSELLHVYPFWGSIILAMVIFISNQKKNILAILMISLMIMIGFYLTLFREYYRYHPPYSAQNTFINLPRTKGIQTDKITADGIMSLANFINSRTQKNDYVFAYPYYPELYFILERRDPSSDIIYFPPLWHQYSDDVILTEVKNKQVKYIIVQNDYLNESKLSRFIQKQKEVFKNKVFIVFKT